MVDELHDAWFSLRRRLEIRSRELQQEVRSYPTPIARCDEQLTKAIAERDAALREFRLANELDACRSAVPADEWLVRLRAFADSLECAQDDVLAAARERILAMSERH